MEYTLTEKQLKWLAVVYSNIVLRNKWLLPSEQKVVSQTIKQGVYNDDDKVILNNIVDYYKSMLHQSSKQTNEIEKLAERHIIKV
jgi:hypothetical protein